MRDYLEGFAMGAAVMFIAGIFLIYTHAQELIPPVQIYVNDPPAFKNAPPSFKGDKLPMMKPSAWQNGFCWPHHGCEDV